MQGITVNNKRTRSLNWSESEKGLLTRLIKEKINIIENKDVSKTNNQMKKTAWQEILQSFNQLNNTERDLTQLVNQWRNTKNNIKKRDFEYRRRCNATGGGPRPPSPPLEDVQIMELLPKEFEIDKNDFDSDSLNTQKYHKKKVDIDINESHCSNSNILLFEYTVPVQKNIDMDINKPGCSRSSIPLLAETVPIVQKEIDVDINKPGCCSPSMPLPAETVPVGQTKIEIDMNKPGSAQSGQDKTNKNGKIMKSKKKKVTLGTSQQDQLFNLAKAAREQQMLYQENEYKKKLEIMQAEHMKRIEIMESEHIIRLEIMKKELEYWETKKLN